MCEPVTVTIGLTFSFWCGVHILRIRASCTNNIDSAGGKKKISTGKIKSGNAESDTFWKDSGKKIEEQKEIQRQCNDLSIPVDKELAELER